MHEKANEAAKLLFLIWRHIDFNAMGRSRLMGIYDEFAGKAKYAAASLKGERFLEEMSRKFGIGSFRKSAILELLTPDILRAIRDDTQYVVLMMRTIVEEERKEFNTRKESRNAAQRANEFYKEADALFEALKEERNDEQV